MQIEVESVDTLGADDPRGAFGHLYDKGGGTCDRGDWEFPSAEGGRSCPWLAHEERWLAGAHVDQLALDWGSGWTLLPQSVECDWLAAEDVEKFQPIDLALSAMTDREDTNLWTPAALHDASEWAEIRSLVTAALLDL